MDRACYDQANGEQSWAPDPSASDPSALRAPRRKYLALVQAVNGDLDNATADLIRAFTLAEQVNDSPHEAAALINLGIVDLLEGRKEKQCAASVQP